MTHSGTIETPVEKSLVAMETPFASHRLSQLLILGGKQMANSNTASSNKISLSADIVPAYVSRNSVTPVGLPALIESVHGALSKLGAVEAAPNTEALAPAVQLSNLPR